MISSGIRNMIQLISILLLLNIVFAVYDTHYKYQSLPELNNQRSVDTNYKYTWFTREIHDDINSDEKNTPQEQQLSPQKIFRMKMLKNILNRKYQNNYESLLESNEKL
ncbi:unnamed protein product [Rotaria sordida]|uniref:Uncharacterized protein n=1 Tax=Rotaria sordida TaxID=392033 RepID=A0A819BSC9_9BILA|nr:unnamed protein product [Rotaria sordida]CAF3796530.1 unnamed protein product [Rotaria sordida]